MRLVIAHPLSHGPVAYAVQPGWPSAGAVAAVCGPVQRVLPQSKPMGKGGPFVLFEWRPVAWTRQYRSHADWWNSRGFEHAASD